jgi:hypothetical protein
MQVLIYFCVQNFKLYFMIGESTSEIWMEDCKKLISAPVPKSDIWFSYIQDTKIKAKC